MSIKDKNNKPSMVDKNSERSPARRNALKRLVLVGAIGATAGSRSVSAQALGESTTVAPIVNLLLDEEPADPLVLPLQNYTHTFQLTLSGTVGGEGYQDIAVTVVTCMLVNSSTPTELNVDFDVAITVEGLSGGPIVGLADPHLSFYRRTNLSLDPAVGITSDSGLMDRLSGDCTIWGTVFITMPPINSTPEYSIRLSPPAGDKVINLGEPLSGPFVLSPGDSQLPVDTGSYPPCPVITEGTTAPPL